MNLPNYLFWDVERKSIDFQKHKRFVIQRVIQKGTVTDWITIKDFYGLTCLKQEILAIRSLDNKTLTFFSTYFSIPKNQFRCYNMQQSIPKHYDY